MKKTHIHANICEFRRDKCYFESKVPNNPVGMFGLSEDAIMV